MMNCAGVQLPCAVTAGAVSCPPRGVRPNALLGMALLYALNWCHRGLAAPLPKAREPLCPLLSASDCPHSTTGHAPQP